MKTHHTNSAHRGAFFMGRMMLKRFLLSLALIVGAVTPSLAAGTINYSLSQQFDSQGNPLSGCKLYFYQAGTTTVQLAYQDSALSIPHAWPLVCDSAGRLPQFYLADGTIKIRLTDRNGVNQGYGGAGTVDGITVIGASSGSGSGTVVDPTTILQTGQFISMYGTGNLTGFVRCNGRTIGSATSGATERANSDTQDLFEYLWTADSNLSVSGGRGASANADWTANKALTLPDCRGRAIAGLDDMGNSAASRLSSTYFGATATTLGAVGGSESTTLSLAQLPTGITVNGTVTVSTSGGAKLPSTSSANTIGGVPTVSTGSLYAPYLSNGAADWTAITSMSGSNTLTSNNTSGSAHRTVQPTILMTTYIKM